jgi:hypothetical protein
VTRRALGAALVGAILTAGLVAGTRVPWLAEPADQALIRLSWRAAGERVEECREPSAAEQAALPAHMRLPSICERRLFPFRLVVRIDGSERASELLHARGASEDRPTTVFRDFRVEPGAHRLEILFEAEGPPGVGAKAHPPLRLEESVLLAPRQILLVTRALDEEGGALRLDAPPRD